MTILDESIVGDDEIDSLGHMNVTYYMTRVMRANERLWDGAGATIKSLRARNIYLSRSDTYCRYQREQFSGATLAVLGGVLEAGQAGAKLFYEVRNRQTDDIAATFILGFTFEGLVDCAPLPLAADLVDSLKQSQIEMPDYGVPRSISLAPPRLDVTYAELEARLGPAKQFALMGDRLERVVDPEDCDSYGFLRAGQDLMFGARRRAQVMKSGKTFGPPTFVSDEGHRFGWAWMETRALHIASPRAGDVLRSIGADIGLQRKTRHSRRWIFNTTRGTLAGIDDTVGIALDLDARRSIEIPKTVRTELEAGFVPEFA